MATQYALRAAGGGDYIIVQPVRIGRDPTCQIVLSGDPRVSRDHAQVWVQDDTLYVRDQNSSNGTIVNGQRLTPSQPQPLRLGDALQVGGTTFVVVAAEAPAATVIAPAPSAAQMSAAQPRRRMAPLLTCGLAAAAGALLLCGLAVVAYALRGPSGLPTLFGQPSSATPAGATVLETSAMSALLAPAEYAASNSALVQAVAALNQAELDYIHAASTGRALAGTRLARFLFAEPDLDEKLRQVAASAYSTALLADRLDRTAAAQDGGSENAGRTAAQYKSIAQLSAALVIQAQDLRQGTAPGQAAATIAEFGARLWNSELADLGSTASPFTAFLTDPSLVPAPQALSAEAAASLTAGFGSAPNTWIAASGEKLTKKLEVPALAAPKLDPNDPATQTKLATAAGQTDSAGARQLAGAIIQAGGGADTKSDQPAGGEVVAAFFSSTAVVAPKGASPAAAPLPIYPSGSVVIIHPGSTPEDIVSTIASVGTDGHPGDLAQNPIVESTPIVNLTISNLHITQINQRPKDAFNTFEADVVYEFDVKWSTNLTAPRFVLDCVSGNHFGITSAAGSQHINAKGLLILYPGAEDAFCYASNNGNTWGSASEHFLVGDSAAATERAIQVETDSVSLDMTLTADAQGTSSAAGTQAAETAAAVGTQNALETEVSAERTAEFAVTITAIARLTALAKPPTPTETPLPTATFAPVLVDTVFHAGDSFAVNTNVVLQTGRLYRFCFSGLVNLINPDHAAKASELDHVNGIGVPSSGCLILEGTGAVAAITCGSGEAAEDPGGFTIQVWDLGPL